MKKRNGTDNKVRHITPSDRSVFHDLGFDESEARVLEMRADLMGALRELIVKRGWTQTEAAERLGVTQPRVSALLKCVWQDFSADMLLLLATRVGLRPRLKLTAPRDGRPREEIVRRPKTPMAMVKAGRAIAKVARSP
jgi:predicted XRE-type DNA-binding protein